MTLRAVPKPTKPVRGTAAARRHLALVAQMTCIICGRSPVHVHHCRDGRFAQTKPSDLDTIPLCPECHDDRHRNPTAWREQHGPDTRYLPLVRETIRIAQESTV